MKHTRKHLLSALALLAAFALWTIAVSTVDVQAIGPQDSAVGFAALNRFVHNLTGAHLGLYILTDWLSLIPVCICLAFGALGLGQWIRRRHILRADRSILALGIFYLMVIAAYLMFEIVVINHRPVLIGGILEASYPSSTTMLVMCVMITARMQLKARTKSILLPRIITAFTVLMVLGRAFSGVHWITDIIGGALLSAGLIALYRAMSGE